MPVGQDDRVTIGRIEKPFGVRGQVKVRSLSDVPGRFDNLHAVTVLGETGQTTDRTVSHVRRAGAAYIVGFQDVTTPEEAGTLRGGLIQVPREPLSRTQEDTYYECDLIGMTVVNQDGRELGRVETVWALPGHHVLVVKDGSRETLIPAAKHFVLNVDVPARRMVVQGVEGLIEDHHEM
ncbi:Ribosome maturation factor RimM [Nitrospira sp. KM1]|uniref:ribosome maturation factor RimM n=1 Tax=Nitrospira sp. KM1 TaxID=1936990 RepID=UPI0013A73C85|nr:ribosome maturation factor RimM [Nitrospira sp. KM1]BCA54291.1 Ribosome maturation factor RimM [Nitrospira sp. KM1]